MKRIITVIVGYAVMAWMIYLIMVTARSTPKIWDPYDILGISRVRTLRFNFQTPVRKILTTFPCF